MPSTNMDEALLLLNDDTETTSLLTVTDKDNVLLVGQLEPNSPTDTPTSGCCVSYWRIFHGLSWRKRLIVITSCLICFISAVCYSVAFPFLPFECEKKGDVSAFSVGLILGSFEFTVFISSIIFGIYMSKIGIWFMFIAGVLIEGFCACLFGVLQWCPGGYTFIVMAVAVRCTEALGCAMCQTAAFAVIAKEFPHSTAMFIGLLEAFEGFGLMTGPPIGGLLYQLGGFLLPFISTGSCLFLCGIVAYLLLPFKNEEDSCEETVPKLGQFFSKPVVLLSGLFITSSAVLITFYDPTLPVQLVSIDERFAKSPAFIGLVFLLDSVTYSLLSPIVGYFSDRFHYNFLLLMIGNIGFLVAYVLIGPLPFLPIPANKLWPVVTAIALLGTFVSFGFMPTFPAMIDDCVRSGMENNVGLLGLVSGFFASAFSLGSFLGPVVGGYLVDNFGFAWASSVMCLLPIVNLLCIAIFSFHRLVQNH